MGIWNRFRVSTSFQNFDIHQYKSTLDAAILLSSTLIVLTACRDGVLSPQGPVGVGEKTILLDALALMLVIVIPTIIATCVFAWWFRAENQKARRRPKWAFSGRLELLVWTIPLLTIMFLGGMTWIASHDLDPYKPLLSKTKPFEVQVISLDWKWLFIYPDQQLASVNEVAVPVGVPIHFTITSASVMNAFFIPKLGSMIYAMNGMATQLSLQADHEGLYPGLSSQFSGDGFPGMHFNLEAMDPERFSAWLARTQTSDPVLDAESYMALSQQSSNIAPFRFRAVDSGLFDAVVTQKIPAGPGPTAGDIGVSPKEER